MTELGNLGRQLYNFVYDVLKNILKLWLTEIWFTKTVNKKILKISYNFRLNYNLRLNKI